MAYFFDLGGFQAVNLSGSVGSKEFGTKIPAENRPMDVELIHFFLYRLYSHPKTKLNRNYKKELENIYQGSFNWNDSRITGRLSKVILDYQYARRRAGGSIFPDGRVDIIRGTSITTSITKTLYTLIMLQGDYSIKYSGKTDGDFAQYVKPTLQADEVLRRAYPAAYTELFARETLLF